jgi:molecular chaperone HtpG
MITQPEFMRRMKEMSAHGGGGMFGMGNLPDMYNLVVNTNHPQGINSVRNSFEKPEGTPIFLPSH